MEELREIPENGRKASKPASNGLTGIPSAIHWPATHISGGSNTNELDRIAIEAYLDALADVTISIVAREHAEKKDQEWDS